MGLGIKSMLKDWGIHVKVKLRSDSSAGRAICKRVGLGRVRHIELQHLWLQQRVRNKEILVEKIAGKENPADALTKFLTEADMRRHLATMGVISISEILVNADIRSLSVVGGGV